MYLSEIKLRVTGNSNFGRLSGRVHVVELRWKSKFLEIEKEIGRKPVPRSTKKLTFRPRDEFGKLVVGGNKLTNICKDRQDLYVTSKHIKEKSSMPRAPSNYSVRGFPDSLVPLDIDRSRTKHEAKVLSTRIKFEVRPVWCQLHKPRFCELNDFGV